MGDSRALATAMGPVGIWSSELLRVSATDLGTAAARLEALGFGALWLPEAAWVDPFVAATVALGATSTLRVATGVARIHGRAALVMSNAWRGLSSWFPDRFVLGLGVSHQPTVEALGGSYARPLAAMRSYLDDLEDARFDGDLAGRGAGTSTHVVLAALGPRMLALAGERTEGAHSYTSTAIHTADARAILGPTPFLAPEVKVVLSTDPREARRTARRSLPLRLPAYAANLVRDGFDPEAVQAGADEVVDALVGWGDDASIHAHVRSHLDAGADHVAVQVLSDQPDPMKTEAWARLADLFS